MNRKHTTEDEHGLQVLALRYRPAPGASVGDSIRRAAREQAQPKDPTITLMSFARSTGFRYAMLAASIMLVGVAAYVTLSYIADGTSHDPIAGMENTEHLHAFSLEEIDTRLAALQTRFRHHARTRPNNVALQRWRKKNGPAQRELIKSRHLIATIKTEININANPI